MRILVTGASGLLGLNMCLRLAGQHDVYGLVNTHSLAGVPFPITQVDLLNREATWKEISLIQPETIIHCAAMANVDECEENPEAARLINTEVPGHLAELCAQSKIHLVYISTDAVFDGKRGDYSEADEPNPQSVYARTKLEGEQRVLYADKNALIARVNFYGFSLSGKRSLAEFFLNNLSAGNRVKGFVDVMFCPLYAPELGILIMKMLQKKLSGIYHTVSCECLSKYTFGVRIAEKFGFDKDLIEPVSVHEGGLLSKRSPRLTLNVEKLIEAGIKPQAQAAGLERFYANYLDHIPELIRSLSG